jgi:hypothetical protein
LQVNHCGFDITVSEQTLDRLEVVIGEKEVNGKSLAKGMRRDAFGNGGAIGSLFDGCLDVRLVKVITALFPCAGN